MSREDSKNTIKTLLRKEKYTVDETIMLCHAFSDICNSFTHDKQFYEILEIEDGEDIRLLKELALEWVLCLVNYKDYEIDPRNEYAVLTARKIINILDIKHESHPFDRLSDITSGMLEIIMQQNNMSELDLRDTAVAISKYMTREHRTIQQTFSGFMFYYLVNCGYFANCDVKVDELDDLYRLPMI